MKSSGSASSSSAFHAGIYASNTSSGTSLSIDAVNASGGNNGIFASNNGSGSLSLKSTGIVTGTNASGVYAYGGVATAELTIDVEEVSGGVYGIETVHNGSGKLSIVNSGTVTGATTGIDAYNLGSGALSVTSNDTVTGISYNGIYANNSGTDLSIETARVNGGNYGIQAANTGTGVLSVKSSGSITGTGGSGIFANGGGASAGVIIDVGDVSGVGNGIYASHSGSGALSLKSTGTVTGTANGIDAVAGNGLDITVNNVSGGTNGIQASNSGMAATSIVVNGTVTGLSDYGIRTLNTADTNITLNSGAAVGGGSGLAIYNDGGDSITTVLSGASLAGSVSLNDGSDDLTFAGGDFSGVTLLDGGDDADVADGFVDTLSFVGSSGNIAASALVNWENIVIGTGVTVGLTDSSLTTALLSISNGGVLSVGSGLSLTGGLSNAGTINAQDGVADDAITVSGNYLGGGALAIDVDFATDSSDTLTIAGNVTGGTTQVNINEVTSGTATGNDIVVIDVTGTTSTTDFALSSGAITSGAYDYDLGLTGNQWVLVGSINSTGDVYKAFSGSLLSFSKPSSLRSRVAQRQWASNETSNQQGAWLRVHGDFTTSESATTSSDTNAYSLQLGYDISSNMGGAKWQLGLWFDWALRRC